MDSVHLAQLRSVADSLCGRRDGRQIAARVQARSVEPRFHFPVLSAQASAPGADHIERGSDLVSPHTLHVFRFTLVKTPIRAADRPEALVRRRCQ